MNPSVPAWTPGNTVPVHSRFRWAPTGHLHIGHAWVTWLNYQAAHGTGGTFSLRIEQLKTMCTDDRTKRYNEYAQRNYDDLCAFGVPPSPREAWMHYGMSPTWDWQVDDDRALIDYYWKLLGFEAIWGGWPPPCDLNPTAIGNHWQGMMLGSYQQGHMHPYLLFAQVAGDVITKRNCLIRGEDLRQESIMVNAYGQALAKHLYGLPGWDTQPQFTPAQYYVPRLMRSGHRLPKELQNPLGLSLSSSTAAVTEGFFIKDVLQARVPRDDVLRLLCRAYLGHDNLPQVQTQMATVSLRTDFEVNVGIAVDQSGLRAVIESMRSPAIIDDDEWFALLQGKELSSAQHASVPMV